MKFCSLYSGSSGNCIFVGNEDTKLLIDAGVSGSRIENALHEIGEDASEIQAVLITHEHYGAIILTAQGKEAYEKIKFKHDSLKRYLTDVLGVSEETADKDACAMEHIISDETFGKIVDAIQSRG